MNNCNWEAIHGFQSPGEYRRFCAWIDSQVKAGLVESISVGNSSVDVGFGFEEKWFKCKESNEVWRLVAPQVPFLGSWDLIK